MKVPAIAVLLACTPLLLAAKKPNPADYTLTMHVQCSFERGGNEQLVATVNGQQLELTNATAILPIALGDYKAILEQKTGGKSYEVKQSYELLFPDGSTRDFEVTGVGSGMCGSAAQ